jgi:hypothetical protein
MRFVLANTTWNSKGWRDASSDPSGFKWVAADPARHKAGESWNFRAPRGLWKYGFFENLGRQVRYFDDGGVVFFLSKNPADGIRYVTGFYARATLLSPEKRRPVKALWTDSLKLPENLPFRPQRHLPSGTKSVRYFVYLNDSCARRLFEDMLALAQDNEAFKGAAARTLRRLARLYFEDVKPSKSKTETTNPPVADETTLRRYVVKDLNGHAGPSVLRITKDNAKLQRSYRHHEMLKQKVAVYLKNRGYVVRTDRHLDLTARKGRANIIVEVKSCRPDNVERQVRQGVAQLNYYTFL